ncbi:extracellular solute-binding protein [Paenibacillus rhizovicinus]|uniref:Extracellular solute-binding protein n=1 Tax=Paenibacillus rhizovicinus TaxID=2704463 RepID=A0A6C0P3E7_9BACL|nr:extracellular solute-binding protein [Paenibacillus rhizovicinus]QHW31192.1 extracellular solute-binding protein [Paenibacillus rhizovicinus]
MKTRNKLAMLSSMLLSLTLVLSACGGTNNNSSNTANDTNKASNAGSADKTNNAGTNSTANANAADTESASDTNAAAATEVKHDPVTLRIVSWAGDDYVPLYQKFHEKYPWITIENVPVNGKSILEVVAANQAAGTPADLSWVDQDLYSFEQNGVAEDLTPYLDTDPTMQSVQLKNGLLDTFKINGKRVAVPFVDVPMWILVNKDLLAKNGLDMPPNDWTYDDLREDAKKMTNPDAGEYGMTTMPEWQMRLLSTKSIADGYANNLQFMNTDLTQSMMGTPGVVDEFKWLKEFVTKDGSMLNYADAKAKGDAMSNFLNGKTGFAIGGSWNIPELRSKANFDWDVLPFPRGTKGQPSYSIWGPMTLLAGSKHKAEAFLYISFQFSKEIQKWKMEQGNNPAIIDPELDAYYDQIPLWKDKNTDAVRISKENGIPEMGYMIPAFGEYQWNGLGNKIIFEDGDTSELIASAEGWNKRTQEVRAALK